MPQNPQANVRSGEAQTRGRRLRDDEHRAIGFSLLKRGVMETWHKLSAKHLEVYLAEMEFRFNRRKRDDLSLTRCVI